MAQYPLELIPIEDDLLSLEMDDVPRDLYLVRHIAGHANDRTGMTRQSTTLHSRS